jgi:hypothetical protein
MKKTVITLVLALSLAAFVSTGMADSGIRYTGDRFLFCADEAPLRYMQALSNQNDVDALEKYIKAVVESDACRMLPSGVPFYKMMDNDRIAMIRIPGEYPIFYTFGWMLTSKPPKEPAKKAPKVKM